MMNLAHWEEQFKQKVTQSKADVAHDWLHYHRVSTTAKKIAQTEGANLAVVVPAAWLHDLVFIEKSDPRRSQASRISADAAIEYLKQAQYPTQDWQNIHHAIAAHSFSADITPTTIEAKVVQDADRLDSLGAIGVARLFATSGRMDRSFYHPEDFWGQSGRTLNDYEFAVDHFFVKLFKLAESFQTQAGKKLAQSRVQFMQEYLKQLQSELGS